MITKSSYTLLVFLLISCFAFSISAQQKKRKTSVKKVQKPVKTEPAANVESVENPEKRNARPEELSDLSESSTPEIFKKNSKTTAPTGSSSSKQQKSKSVYFYEFSRPEFTVDKIFIDHNENGMGTIRFTKNYYEEEISDPLTLSSGTIEKVKILWQKLNFLESTENYQYEKDYSHLGNMKFTMKRDGRERTATFNWTENPDAKALMEEYRRISNQFIWIFDMNLSRENQPLESSKIINSLDSLISRNEIADPEQMLPYLRDLGDDERIPLLSRNHAKRIVAAIEKKLAKKP